MNFRQSAKVPIRGARKEKKSQNLYEALVVSIFLLFLFLTGCSGSMIANQSSAAEPESVIRLTGEANLPPPRVEDAMTLSLIENSNMDGSLKAFIQQEAVIDRVRLVVGWLKFVRQMKSAELVENGWARLNSGQQRGVLKTDSVPGRPDIAIRELILWRQILTSNTTADVAPIAEGAAERFEALAISLTSATNPEDVAKIDNLLVVPERYAEY